MYYTIKISTFFYGINNQLAVKTIFKGILESFIRLCFSEKKEEEKTVLCKFLFKVWLQNAEIGFTTCNQR